MSVVIYSYLFVDVHIYLMFSLNNSTQRVDLYNNNTYEELF